MRAILHGGKSHGSLLHAVPETRPDWANRLGEVYRHTGNLGENPRVWLYCLDDGKRPDDDTLQDWIDLLDDFYLFKGPEHHRSKRRNRRPSL